MGNLIVDNTALVGEFAAGGGVLWRGSVEVQLLQNTFVGNTSPSGSAIADVSGGHRLGQCRRRPGRRQPWCIALPSPGVLLVQRRVQRDGIEVRGLCGDLTGWFGNISADPLFVSATDFRLQAGSPAIDAGDPAATGLPATDLAGAARVTDGNGDGMAVVDMGAYEAPGVGTPVCPHPPHPPRPGAGPFGPDATLNLQVTGQGAGPARCRPWSATSQ